MSEFPEYERDALYARLKEHIEAFKELEVKLEKNDFTACELEWHGEDPLEETHWSSFIEGFFVGRGLSVADAKAVAIHIN